MLGFLGMVGGSHNFLNLKWSQFLDARVVRNRVDGRKLFPVARSKGKNPVSLLLVRKSRERLFLLTTIVIIYE